MQSRSMFKHTWTMMLNISIFTKWQIGWGSNLMSPANPLHCPNLTCFIHQPAFKKVTYIPIIYSCFQLYSESSLFCTRINAETQGSKTSNFWRLVFKWSITHSKANTSLQKKKRKKIRDKRWKWVFWNPTRSHMAIEHIH